MKKIISNILVKLFIKKSVILSNARIGESFQLLTIKLPKKKEWYPGQKIQIKVTEDELRSYTPSQWESDNRTFQTLIFNHRSGPGARWSNSVRPLTKVEVVGPRNSLDIRESKDDIFFFGDETTYGLATILENHANKKNVTSFFEATDVIDSKKAFEMLGLKSYEVYEKSDDDQHLKLIVSKIKQIYKDEMIIISGKMSSIQFIYDQLSEFGITPEKMMKKRYWGWKKEKLSV